MKHLAKLLSLAICAGAIAGLGCYTMIRHPETDMTTAGAGSMDRSCADCHADADYYHWVDPYYTQFYRQHPASWGAYYAHPWWHSGQYGYDTGSGDHHPPANDGEQDNSDGRSAWGRGGSTPYQPPSVPHGAVIIPGGSSNGGASGSGGAVPSGQNNSGKKDEDGGKSDQNKDKDKDKKQEPERDRRAWGR